MTKREIRDLVDQLGDIVARLEDADPHDKAEVYHHLGLYLRVNPARTGSAPKRGSVGP
jgi:hypothetical protein